MATSTSTFEERIARAKEAARLASLAASARSGQQSLQPPAPAAFHAFAPRGFAPPAAPLQTLHASAVMPPPAAAAPHAIPDDVKHRIDRLVEFIQRNGAAFEETVRQRERENPHFAFLQPTAPFHDYFVWKKRAVCGDSAGVGPPVGAGAAPMQPMAMPMAPPRPHFVSSTPLPAAAPAVPPPMVAPTSVSPDALLSAMPVGAMANVCKLARKNGLAPYAPIPSELLWQTSTLPPVEPARLEIRLAEFYRDLPTSST